MTDIHKERNWRRATSSPRHSPSDRVGRKSVPDCRTAIGAHFPHHFPTVYAACMSAGIDPTQLIPAAPAAHYHMGGIASTCRDVRPSRPVVGQRLDRLHGANRLASNSLLEGLIFGARVAEDVRGRFAGACAVSPAPPRFASPAPPQRAAQRHG
jgi:L-aspartate oxidase